MNRRSFFKWFGIGAAAAPVAAVVAAKARPAVESEALDAGVFASFPEAPLFPGQLRAIYQCVPATSVYTVIDPGHTHSISGTWQPGVWGHCSATVMNSSSVAAVAYYEQWTGKEWVRV